ncbi:DUF72 domain-containing protein [Sphingomonas quercus]|uniref:DUF72 domain-containing protein n=1 Tax=Sphingomonas quercus TaxID=2842451 RepID=A0ABS6BFM7_9SPHN|nr:DUF72 domain-containing protein [Sphingomonas quercus]MBU3076999.1 DUF72 domain-containing protein [Sphingomonas quercus]
MTGAIRVGVGGWTYEPWRGVFYPEGLPQKRELDYAAGRLTAIEINGTYYGSQKPATFAAWARAVPDGFIFSLKASRYCTNRRVLAEAGESIAKFLSQGITELGDRLGPILWQFMATKQFQPDDFAAFLALLPKEQGGLPLRHVLEVRHESFRDPAFFALARKANAAIVLADSDEVPVIDESTADFSYARLMRAEEQIETGYDAAGLDHWAGRAREMAQRGDAFLFFISGAKVRNPAAAQALIDRVGRP